MSGPQRFIPANAALTHENAFVRKGRPPIEKFHIGPDAGGGLGSMGFRVMAVSIEATAFK